MDKNVERYINYVVQDLMKNMVMQVPDFILIGDVVEIDYVAFASRNGYTIDHKFVRDLKHYIVSKYGVRDSELNLIWFRFRHRVREEIIRPSEDKYYWLND